MAMNKQERENVAANAVADVLSSRSGVDVVPSKWDDGSADRMHDFYLEAGDSRIALEVSTIANGHRVGRDHRWDAKAPNQQIPVEDLTGAWLATVESNAEVDDVVRVVTTHVPTLASLGATTVDTRSWQDHVFTPPEHRPAEFEPLRALRQVGVTNVSQMDNAPAEFAGTVQVLRAHGHTRPADRNFPVTFLNDQLSSSAPNAHASDVTKLSSAVDAMHRHLWLWVEVHEGMPILRSFEAEGLPTEDIDCAALDGLWLGSGITDSRVAGVCWLRDSGWHHFESDMNRTVG